jgi:hypothetical protein
MNGRAHPGKFRRAGLRAGDEIKRQPGAEGQLGVGIFRGDKGFHLIAGK